MKCRACGCTQEHACDLGDLGPCWWVGPDLCSACAARIFLDNCALATFALSELARTERLWRSKARNARDRAAALRVLTRLIGQEAALAGVQLSPRRARRRA